MQQPCGFDCGDLPTSAQKPRSDDGPMHDDHLILHSYSSCSNNSTNTSTMIATIATVTLAASATPNPVVGRFTQGLGEPCDMVSNCQQGMQCTTGLFGTDGTGRCIEASGSSAAIPTATSPEGRQLGTITRKGFTVKYNFRGDSSAGTSPEGQHKLIFTASLWAQDFRGDSSAGTSPEGQRKLIGWTQSLGEPCDMVTFCKSGLRCNNPNFGTGTCVNMKPQPKKQTWEQYSGSFGRKLGRDWA